MSRASALLCASAGLLGCFPGPGAASPGVRLGAAPLCEASAVRLLPCPEAGESATCAVVGDNEVKDRLFSLRIDGRELIDQRELPLSPAVEDIEAIESIGDALLVVGSHSRRSWKRRCEPDADRRVLARVRRGPAGYEGAAIRTSGAAWTALLHADCTTRLLGRAGGGGGLVSRVCAAFSAAEDHATDSSDRCAEAFNIEGAVGIPGVSGRDAVWLGLRSPLVAGRAVLLRLVGNGEGRELAFDGVATIDLSGWGIRDLAFSNGWVLGIAGPLADAGGGFRLWRTSAENLADGNEIGAEGVEVIRTDLLAGSEGLAPAGPEALVVVDGDRPSAKGGDCGVPAGKAWIPLAE